MNTVLKQITRALVSAGAAILVHEISKLIRRATERR